VTVASGATLAGTGTVSSTTVQSGGILAAGGAGTVGTLNVSGDLTLNAGSIVNADISATAADKTAVTGTAAIAGILNGTFAASGTYAASQYAVITSTGTLSGTFANFNIANLPANFVSTLSYDAHDVFMNLAALSSSGTTNIDSGTTTISGSQTIGGLSSSGSGGTVNVSSGSTLTDNQNTNTTFSGTIAGPGAVVKAGTGTLILDGVNMYTGGTAINGGTLEIGDITHKGASIQGPVTVGSGGTLQGHGTINGAVTIGSGGSLQPGGTIGTISVGSASFASGSAFAVETSAAQADLLNAAGAVSIASGAKLAVTEDAPLTSFARTTTYTIVQAGGGVSGTFSTVTSSSASFLPTVTYTANAVSLTLLRPDLAAALATNTNQANAAAAVIAGGASALTTPLGNMSDADVRAAYSQLSGDIHASLRSAAVEDSRIIRDAVLDHLNGRAPGTGVWAVGFGGYGSIATDGNASGLHHNTAGFVGGADINVGSGFRLGLGGGYTSNDSSTSGRVSIANGNSSHVLGYAGWGNSHAEIKLGGEYGWGTANVTRTVAAYTQTDSGRQDQRTSQVFGEFGYRIGRRPIVPYVDVVSVSATTGAFAETGGSAALSGAEKTDTQTYSTVGLRVSFPMAWVRPRFDVGWQHAFDSFLPTQLLTLQSVAQSFTVLGAPWARDAAAVRAGFAFTVSPNASLSLDYDGSVGRRVQNNAVRGGLDWRF
jgi:fibronectin-binding autotransporter adhesin